MVRRILAPALLMILVAAPSLGGEKTRWLHVRVEEDGRHGERVSVNVPVSLIETVLPLLDEEEPLHGHFRIGDSRIEQRRFRELLERLDRTPDGEEQEFDVDDGRAWASRSGENFQLRVLDRHEDDEALIRMPMALARLLCTMDSEPDDFAKALASLDDSGGEIQVIDEDEETHIRIWIDDRSGPE